MTRLMALDHNCKFQIAVMSEIVTECISDKVPEVSQTRCQKEYAFVFDCVLSRSLEMAWWESLEVQHIVIFGVECSL